jgi:hypothetical protein
MKAYIYIITIIKILMGLAGIVAAIVFFINGEIMIKWLGILILSILLTLMGAFQLYLFSRTK